MAKEISKDARPPSKPTGRVYFTTETEKAIIEFNASQDEDDRNTIYRERIEYPLDKLAENIINRFKFPYVNQSFEDTKRQVVSFLVISLPKFSKGKGKAFSYFSVIAKNYLILHNNNGYKNEKRSVYLSDKTESDIPIEEVLNLEHPSTESQDDVREFYQLVLTYWDLNMPRIFKKKRDTDIANAVLELMRRAQYIENFNKKALYLMIREMTNCKTSYITKVVNKMRVIIMRQWAEYQEYGLINLEESKFFIYK